MRVLLFFVLVLCLNAGFGQYYFNDVVSAQFSNEQYKLLRSNKIHKVKATSFEADNSVTEGFLVEEEISLDGKRIIQTSSLSGGKTSVVNRFYELNKLKRTQTLFNGIETKTEYTYSDKGAIQKILITTTDTAMKATTVEAHEWMYNEAGQPISMLKIKNRTDTTLIELLKDENGLVIEEHWKRKNRNLETYYYYYDSKNLLTDIVRFNARLKKLLPDFQYEYDTNGQVSQMTQVSMSSSSYIIWKYTYNEKGLKQKEVGYDKERRLVGRIEYTYE